MLSFPASRPFLFPSRSFANIRWLSSASSTEPSADTPARPLRKPRRQRLRVRPGQTPKVYPRAIPFGQNHVYDQALRVIVEDSRNLQKELASLHPLLHQANEANNAQEVERLSKKINILEIQSKINLPSVRWRFIRGTGDSFSSTNPAFHFSINHPQATCLFPYIDISPNTNGETKAISISW